MACELQNCIYVQKETFLNILAALICQSGNSLVLISTGIEPRSSAYSQLLFMSATPSRENLVFNLHMSVEQTKALWQTSLGFVSC